MAAHVTPSIEALLDPDPERIGGRVKRFDIHGNELTQEIHVARCYDCGMGLVHAAEFHPPEACEMFKATHDSVAVWTAILPLLRERMGLAA